MCHAAIQPSPTEVLVHAEGALLGPVDRPKRFALGKASIRRNPQRNPRHKASRPSPRPVPRQSSHGFAHWPAPEMWWQCFSSGHFGRIYEMLLSRL